MNHETPHSGPPNTAAAGIRRQAPMAVDWARWARRLLWCNPFFLCSAAFLLFAINQLANDDKLFPAEKANLLFNFSALQFYEVLVVGTALLLVRRKAWYDSALLVVLEHGLVLVPFMLLSQAVVQGEAAREGLRLASLLSIAGGAAAILRVAAVRRWFTTFNLPPRALGLGALILAGNVALPMAFRPRMELDVADWSDENRLLWLLVLPLLAAGANLLPRPTRYGGLNPERPWLPLFIYALWVMGSAVHVWCVAHICSLPLQAHHLGPLLWVAGWTLWNRLSDCVCPTTSRMQAWVLGLTAAMPLVAMGESGLFLAMSGANLVAYGVLWWRSTDNWPLRSLVRHCALVSVALMFAGLPLSEVQSYLPQLDRTRAVILGAVVFALLHSLRSRRPEAGIVAALALGVALLNGLPPRRPPFLDGHFIAQVSLVFLLLHSLRWNDRQHAGAANVRWGAALVWTADVWWWMQDAGWSEILGSAGLAFFVTAMWLGAWQLMQARPPMALPVAAGAVVAAAPVHWLFHHGSRGVLALLASLALFGLGTIVAWTRHRWERRGQSGQG